jgi:L-amino acid N-acyltransferase YncA
VTAEIRIRPAGQLLVTLIDAARRGGLRSILANIPAGQAATIRLHENSGFQRVAHHPRQGGTKFNRWFDAVYLQLFPEADTALETASSQAGPGSAPGSIS